MNNQEAFDTVLTKLRKQKVRSVDTDSITCLYRGTNGNKCAAGHLIPDALYRPDMERKAIFELINTDPALRKELGSVKTLLSALQKAHDQHLSLGLDRWEGEMARIADQHNLKYTPPEVQS